MEGVEGGKEGESSGDEVDRESDSGEGSIDSDEPLATIQKKLQGNRD